MPHTHTQELCDEAWTSICTLTRRKTLHCTSQASGGKQQFSCAWCVLEDIWAYRPSFTSEHCSLNRKQRRRKRMSGCTMRQLAQLSVNAKNEIMTGSCQSWVHCYDWLICILDMLCLPASGWCCPVFCVLSLSSRWRLWWIDLKKVLLQEFWMTAVLFSTPKLTVGVWSVALVIAQVWFTRVAELFSLFQL